MSEGLARILGSEVHVSCVKPASVWMTIEIDGSLQHLACAHSVKATLYLETPYLGH